MNIRTKIILLLLFISINATVFYITEVDAQQKVDIVLKDNLRTLQTHYKVLLETQKSTAIAIYKSTIGISKVIEILSEANSASKERKAQLREELGKLLYEKVGIVREENALKEAEKKIEEFEKELDKMGLGDRSRVYNTNLIELLKFRNSITLSKLIVSGALERKESIGAHYRES